MIEIFSGEYCPFCKKVITHAIEIGLKEGEDFVILDINEDKNRERLLSEGGKRQIPFMIDGNIKMYESDAIIQYLDKKKA